MSYIRPTYTETVSRIAADIAALPAALRGPLSVALGKGDHGQYGFLEWIDRQCSPLTCDEDRLYDWAALYGVQRLVATAAIGNVLATGAPASIVLADTVLRGNNGLDYIVVAAVTLGAGETAIAVRCAAVGAAGNLAAGQQMRLVDPAYGVADLMTVDGAGMTGGAAEEDVDAWRARVCDEWQTMTTTGARGGKDEDYRFWARSAHPSVTTALVQRHVLGYGTVIVRPICNALAERLPTEAVLDAVAALLLAKAPATADWRVTAPTVRPVAVSIVLSATVDTAPNRSAISAALAAAVRSEQSESSVLSMAELDAAIATVTTQYTRLAPLADIAVSAGEVLVLQPVVWA